VWGITVLTSFGDGDLRETGVASSVEAQVLRLAGLADEVGLDGLVCSPWEAAAIRRRSSLALVTPGVSWGGVRGNDQRRLASPGEAWRNGADYLVVGRGVLQSPDPRRAVREILKEGIP
jgi:orotidine-5'-phosphate decarboxylase